MSFKKWLGNHNHHAKGSSLREIFIKMWMGLLQHTSFKTLSNIYDGTIFAKCFVIHTCLTGSSGHDF